MATTWRKIIVSGSNAELADLSVSGKLSVTGSVYANLAENSAGNKKVVIFDTSTKQLFYTSSGAGGGGGIFVSRDSGDYYATDNTLVVSGSILKTSPTDDSLKQIPASNANSKYAFIVSESAYFANHNVGHPNSLSWQTNLDNTIFDLYDANTDVSQILRTIVGVISASDALNSLVTSPTPNASAWSTTTIAYQNEGATTATSTWQNVYVPNNDDSSNVVKRVAPIRYLLSKGFTSAGDSVFKNVSGTVYQTTAFSRRPLLTSNPSDYFDAGNAGEGVTFIGKVTQSFSDTASVTTPNASTATYTTQSYVYRTSTADIGPLYVRDIASGTPTVIPAQYQEAKYTQIPSLDSRRWTDGTSYSGISVAANNDAISSSGYYRWYDYKLGFASKSNAAESELIGGSLQTSFASSTRFYTPLTKTDITTIRPQNPIGKPAGGVDTQIAYPYAPAESRSLSGAPYLIGANWVNIDNIVLPGLFDPLYYSTTADTTIAEVDTTKHAADNLVISKSSGGRTVVVNSGQLQVGSYVVYGGTPLSQGELPKTPELIYSASIGAGDFYSIGTLNNDVSYNVNHTNATEGYPASENTYFTVRGKIKAWDDGNYDTIYTKDVPYHAAGTYGQPASSGSMLYWMFNTTPAGTEAETVTATRFRAETRRLQVQGKTIADSVASTWDSDDRLALGADGDLQYKAGVSYGYLVNPEHGADSTGVNTDGGYGYWYPTGSYSNAQHKWAVQKFNLGLGEGASYNSLTITIIGDSGFDDLVTWDDTTPNKYSIGVIFSKQLDDAGNPAIFDVAGTGTFDPSLNGQSAQSPGINPFNETVDIKKGWDSRSADSGVITLGLSSGVGQAIVNPSGANNYSEIYVVIRYKGAPSNTLRAISVSGS